jgi:multimeric flavodoxin WrbA
LKQLLIVFHAPSENTLKMRQAMEDAIVNAGLEQVSLNVLPPMETQPKDVLACDAIILGTTENLGYMSGALKDFFDRCYYPVLEQKQGLPVAAVVRAGHDGTGTCRALQTIITGLKWRWVQDILVCRGDWQDGFVDDCHELAEAMVCALEQGII